MNSWFIKGLALGGFCQGVVLATALFRSKKGHRNSNFWLAIFMLLLAVCSLLSILSTERYDGKLAFPWLFETPFPINFLFGPVLYFYVRSVFQRPKIQSFVQWLHFIPFVASVVCLLPTFQLSNQEKASLHPSHLLIFLSITQMISLVVYSLISLIVYLRCSRTLYQNHSTIEENHLKILKFLLVSSVVLMALGLLIRIVHVTFLSNWIVPTGGAILVLIMGYRGYFVPDLFAQDKADPQINELITLAPKYNKSGLKSELIENHKLRLFQLMTEQKLYRDSTLSLQKLAKEMHIPPNHLSQLLNEQLKKRFFDFINDYRIHEAKILLERTEEAPNILELAFQVGFNSKSTFYSAFKRIEGCTPLEYCEKIRATKINH